MKVAAAILAAGNSSRLGEPKQLADFEGRTLLEHAVSAARGAGCSPIVVVAGAHVNLRVGESGVEFVQNDSWERGLGTTIRKAIDHVLQRHPEAEAVLLMTCDQPLVRAESLRRLVEAQEASDKGIIAAEYADTSGVPALFLRTHFQGLLALADEDGAKKYILSHATDVGRVPLPEAAEDIDTPAQLARLRRGQDGLR